MQDKILRHKDANIIIADLENGKKKINVSLLNNDLYIPKNKNKCETLYPIDLINKILDVKGPHWLCDEILRDESTDYVQKNLKYDILCYVSEEEFKNKRLLDFGCGSGASTMILARMFSHTKIVGIELEEKLLNIAKLRLDYYGYKNVELKISPNSNQMHPNIGFFDYVVLSAVYEHLLPNERFLLLPKIWSILKPGGILFIDQTPNRDFPIEFHTTGGLPFINYLPDDISLFYAHHFSKKKLKNIEWDELLRHGIRGGSIGEIFDILYKSPQKPVLLNPCRFGIKDRLGLFNIQINKTKLNIIFIFLMKFLKNLTGIYFLPNLSLAIKKEESILLK